ncbi:MAG TPA: uroporphyrinogen-III synthase, partial [Chloroflexota bacterium]|nr:uroporphyrinogen-III synthase [Chloroflexota bacterium]
MAHSTPTENVGPLSGARIALTGTRKAQETADFVTRLGGIPIVAPSLSTSTVDPGLVATANATTPGGAEAADGARDVVSLVSTEDIALYIFLTGVGARALFRAAEAQGMFDRLRANLERASVVVRGPKALGALKGTGFRVDWMPPRATVEEILAGLDRFEVRGRTAVVQLSGFADDRLR